MTKDYTRSRAVFVGKKPSRYHNFLKMIVFPVRLNEDSSNDLTNNYSNRCESPYQIILTCISYKYPIKT